MKKAILFLLLASIAIHATNQENKLSILPLKKEKRSPKYPNFYFGLLKATSGLFLICPIATDISAIKKRIKEHNEKEIERDSLTHDEKPFYQSYLKKINKAVGFKELSIIPDLAAAILLIYDGVFEAIESFEPKDHDKDPVLQ